MMPRLRIIPAFIAILISLTGFHIRAEGIKGVWDVDFAFIFDNREGDHDVVPAKTTILTRLAPEGGLQFGAGGRHSLMGGVVWIQPVGNGWHDYRLAPTLYYRYAGSRWSGAVGMFPRTLLHEGLPSVMWGDSLTYYQRNIRGGLIQYHTANAFADIYLDWRQLQTDTKREAFNIVVNSRWNPRGGKIGAGLRAMMNHYALTALSLPEEHIVDNFLINPYVALNLGGRVALDSLTLRAGPVLTIERNRAEGGWRTPLGAWIEAYGSYSRWFARNLFYAGGVQMPSYAAFGGALYQGEPFFSRKFYDRLDAGFRIINTSAVRLDATLDFNFYSGGFIFYQKITAEVALPISRNNAADQRILQNRESQTN